MVANVSEGPGGGRRGGGRVVVGREVLFSVAAAEAEAAEAGGVTKLRTAGTTARLSMIMMATYRALRAACGNIHLFIKIYMFLFVRLRCEAGRQAGKRVDAGREWKASDGLSGGSLRGDGGGGGDGRLVPMVFDIRRKGKLTFEMLTLRLSINPCDEPVSQETLRSLLTSCCCNALGSSPSQLRVRWLLLEDGDGRRWTPVGDRFLVPPVITIRSRRRLLPPPPGAAPGGEWMGGGRAIGNFSRQCIGPASLSLARPAADRAWILRMGGAQRRLAAARFDSMGEGSRDWGRWVDQKKRSRW